ncbi:(1-_4)-alpha-D-glucan 1-alpha-D-glucosylmutase [Inquilinus ginsengisoli]|uniref:malto-oligosyltrehalose synthase n=1 Tax=Inquilinus ginsengisoli TaxID=363840 RepID=UPI003D1C04E1
MIAHPPCATARLQIHAGFTLDDARAALPYLARLGISHVYASPLLAARPGSGHGYDVIDPTRIDPERGGEAGFERFAAALRSQGLGLILDIVPNHMAASLHNPWWRDVLEHGRASPHAAVFDIDWNAPAHPGRLLLPILGQRYGEALRAGDIKLRRDPETGRPVIAIPGHTLPVAPGTVEAIDETLGPDALHAILERQHYRLAHWRVSAAEINYRRFFDIDDLVAVRVEDPAVFDATHSRILAAVATGQVQGLRIDHIDGLADPAGYLARLRQAVDAVRPGPFTIWVEKILAEGEDLPAGWPVEGTTGYEVANAIHALQVDPAAAGPIRAAYAGFTGDQGSMADTIRRCRRAVIEGNLAAPFEALVDPIDRLAYAGWDTRDLTRADLREALATVIEHLQAYRDYPGDGGTFSLDAAIARARETVPGPALDAVAKLVSGGASGDDAALILQRFQQLTGAVAAKAVEDTAFYRHLPLASLNEVGGWPERFGIEPDDFHAIFARRRQLSPDALSSLSTHDHKRGADVRARLAALTELAPEWQSGLVAWSALLAPQRGGSEDRPVPSRRHEHLFYQTVLGTWPAGGPDKDYADRIVAYLLKAAREGKDETGWTDPDQAYEAGLERFIRAALDPSGPFPATIAPFAERLARIGAINGLAQLAMQMTLPGVPDLYQGTEEWDLSLVDPDNRRPVEWDRLAGQLDPVAEADPEELAIAWPDARIKHWLAARLLRLRREDPELFARGDYAPVPAQGPAAAHVVAWRRSLDGRHLVVAVPRLVAGKLNGALGLSGFDGTALTLPDGRSVGDGERGNGGSRADLGPVFGRLPVFLHRLGGRDGR